MEEKLTYSEKRRKQFESKRHKQVEKEMKLAETREKNKQPITDEETAKRSIGTQKGKFLSDAIKAYIRGDEEYLDNNCSDRLKDYVKMMYDNAKTNSSFIQEINNRIEGKVKDEIVIEKRISDHIPDQKKHSDTLNKYKAEKPEEKQETIQ